MFNFTFDHDAIIKQLGIESMDDDFKAQVIDRINALLSERMGTRVMEELSNEELTELDKLGADKEKAREWLEKRFPSHQEMYQELLDEIVSQVKLVLEQGK